MIYSCLVYLPYLFQYSCMHGPLYDIPRGTTKLVDDCGSQHAQTSVVVFARQQAIKSNHYFFNPQKSNRLDKIEGGLKYRDFYIS